MVSFPVDSLASRASAKITVRKKYPIGEKALRFIRRNLFQRYVTECATGIWCESLSELDVHGGFEHLLLQVCTPESEGLFFQFFWERTAASCQEVSSLFEGKSGRIRVCGVLLHNEAVESGETELSTQRTQMACCKEFRNLFSELHLQLSSSSILLRPSISRQRAGRIIQFQGYPNETNLSTPQHPPEKNARFSCSHEDQERSQDHQCPTCQRQKKISRVNRFNSLTRQADFDRIYRRADKVWHSPDFVLFFKANSSSAVAFVAGKKVGNAVRRNRAKRRLRALFRESEMTLLPGQYILVAKAPIVDIPFSRLQKEWDHVLKRSKVLRKA